MMKVELLFLLTYVCTLTPVYHTQEGSPSITDLTFRNMDFAMNLYRRISSYHDSNIFFSPLSISTAFATLAMAAEGVTQEEIMKVLNLADLERAGQPELIPELFQHLQGNVTQNKSLNLDQGTALFVDLTFEVEKAFSDDIKRYFNADIKNLDFADTKSSIVIINDYIKSKTGNKIQKMITSLEPLTQLMLINTIFFQGGWQMVFNPNNTENGRFYVDNYNIVQVPMMFRVDKYYMMEDDNLKSKVLKLPYMKGVSMLILLPNKGRDYTANDDEITAEKFLFWVKNLEKTKLEVQLPKFKMDQSYEMHSILPDLGIRSIFQGAANLTKLSKNQGLKVSQVLHKAVIEVDEEGTTAAAATTVGIVGKMLPSAFIVNRPFLFFIYHEATNNLLFMGRVIDPTKN